jgi:hypothetical protein
VLLDQRNNLDFSVNKRLEFNIASPAGYQNYDLRVVRNRGGAGADAINEVELIDSSGKSIIRPGVGLALASGMEWGRMTLTSQSIVKPGTLVVPSALAPWPFTPRVSEYTRGYYIEPSACSGTAIQQAIDSASTTRSVLGVHLPKCSSGGVNGYSVDSTIVVPTGFQKPIVGDSASEHGTVLRWTGTGTGPVMQITGSSPFTLQDLVINAANGADGISIATAQALKRVFGNQVNVASGSVNSSGTVIPIDTAFNLQNLGSTAVSMQAFGMSSFNHGIRIAGTGSAQFLTGASSSGVRNYDVQNGADLLVTATWYEGPQQSVSHIDLTSASSGRLTVASNHIAIPMAPGVPAISGQDFNGDLTLLNNLTTFSGSNRLRFQGTGTANVFGAILRSQDTNSTPTVQPVWNINSPWINSAVVGFTAPNATENSTITHQPCIDLTGVGGYAANCRGYYPNYTNGAEYVAPSNSFVDARLSVLRNLDSSPSTSTELRLIRVIVNGSVGKTAVRISGGAN